MRLMTGVPMAMVLLAASCTAQISIGGRNIDFGVKRKKPSSPTVKLLNPATYKAGTTVTLELKVTDFDESKGFSVYTRTPCHAAGNVEKAGEGVYKVNVAIDDTESNGYCQVTLRGLAKNDGANVEIPYQQDPAARALKAAAFDAFADHKTWAMKHSDGTTSTYKVFQFPGMPKPQSDGNSVAIVLTEPKTSQMAAISLERPDKVHFSLNNCQMEGTLSGSTATLKPVAFQGNSCADSSVTLQAQ